MFGAGEAGNGLQLALDMPDGEDGLEGVGAGNLRIEYQTLAVFRTGATKRPAGGQYD